MQNETKLHLVMTEKWLLIKQKPIKSTQTLMKNSVKKKILQKKGFEDVFIRKS